MSARSAGFHLYSYSDVGIVVARSLEEAIAVACERRGPEGRHLDPKEWIPLDDEDPLLLEIDGQRVTQKAKAWAKRSRPGWLAMSDD